MPRIRHHVAIDAISACSTEKLRQHLYWRKRESLFMATAHRKNQLNALSVSFQMMGMILIAFLVMLLVTLNDDSLSIVIMLSLTIAYGVLFRAFFRPVALQGNRFSFFTPELTFQLFYFTLFFLPYQLFLVGVITLDDSKAINRTFSAQSQSAILISTIGLIAFAMGMDGPRYSAQLKKMPRIKRWILADNAKSIDISCLVMLVLSVSIYLLSGLRNLNESRYVGEEGGGPLANIYDIIVMLSMIVAAQAIASIRYRKMNIYLLISMLIVAFWSTRMLLAGDRNNVFLIVCVAASAVSYYLIRIRRFVFALLIPLSILVYNAVGVVRAQADPSMGAIVQEMVNNNSDSNDPSKSSFLNTTIALRAVIAVVPEREPYGLGKFVGIQALGVVPFWRAYILPDGIRYTSSSRLQTDYVLGSYATWGIGTSILADIFADFGVVGIIVVMFLVGRAALIIQRSAIAYPWSPFARTLYIMTTAIYFEYPRYGVGFPLKMLAWTAAMLIVINFLYARLGGRGPRRRSHALESADMPNGSPSLEA